MALLTDGQMRAIQRIGEQSFKVTCILRKKLPFGKDLSNPMGDSDISYSTAVSTFKGWLVPTTNAEFTMGVSQIVTGGNFRLRVPVDYRPDIGDKITIDGKDHYVADSSIEQTWPEWVTVRVRRIQG